MFQEYTRNMSDSDFYTILGVSKSAGDQEIKKAYRKLSLQYHPDRNPGADSEEKIRKINEAYEILSDPAKRKQYDAGGMDAFHGGGGGPDMGDMNDIFSMFFGGGMPGMGGMAGMPGVRMHSMGGMGGMGGMPNIRIFHNGVPMGGPGGFPEQFLRQKPGPIQTNVVITMQQAYEGCTIPVEVNRWRMNGNIRIQETEMVYVTVPKGIDENEMLVVQGKGHYVDADCCGDVRVAFQIHNTTPFQRQGMDLHYRKTITLKDALCGFSFEIAHINGKTLSLNNRTNPTIIRPNFKKVVPTLGIQRSDGATGNLVIEFDVEFPDTLTTEQIGSLSGIL